MEVHVDVSERPKDVPRGRQPYVTPVCEHLGAWRALTLQQSVPVGGLSFVGDPA